MQEYKDISCVFKKENFKKQIVVSCLFRSIVLLYIGFIQLINNALIDLFFLVGISISYLVTGFLEKKEIFIARKYFQLNRYRSIYVIGFILLMIILKEAVQQSNHLTLYMLLIVPIEIFASYMEYRLFLKKMDYFRLHDIELDDTKFF